MCIAREHFNLCKCGCPEIVHEEPDFFTTQLLERLGSEPSRGKCRGQIPLPLSLEELREEIGKAKERGETKVALTKPCECEKFEPMFQPMCGGF